MSSVSGGAAQSATGADTKPVAPASVKLEDALQARGPSEVGTYGVGLCRYMNMGKRYLPGQWPKGEPLAFDTKDTILIYDKRPPSGVIPHPPHVDHRAPPAARR